MASFLVGANAGGRMLPPRLLQAMGLLLVAAGVVGFLTPLGWPALVVGVGLGLGLLSVTIVEGGPRPIPESGIVFEEAMAVLRRASVGGTLVAGAAVAVTAALWWLGRAGPVDLVLVFLLGLVVAYASTIAAVALITVTEVAGRD